MIRCCVVVVVLVVFVAVQFAKVYGADGVFIANVREDAGQGR